MQPTQLLNNLTTTPDNIQPAQATLAPLAAPTSPNVVVSDVKKVVSEISKDYKSPAFWFHLAVQVATWVGFFSTNNTSIKVGAITLSGASILGYFTHLAFVKKYL